VNYEDNGRTTPLLAAIPNELSGTTASRRRSADANGTPVWSTYLDVLPPRGFVTDRSSVRLSFGGGSRRWLSGIRVGPFAAAAAAVAADAPAAADGPVVAAAAAAAAAAAPVAGVVLACRPRFGIRTPGWAAPEAALGVVADGRAAAVELLPWLAPKVAVERWSPARPTDEAFCSVALDATGVLAPVLDTAHTDAGSTL